MVLPVGNDGHLDSSSGGSYRVRNKTVAEIFTERAAEREAKQKAIKSGEHLSQQVLTPAVISILTTQGLERFAFFGFRTILILFLHLELGYGELDAISIYAYLTFVANLSPLVGALLADGRLGCFRTVLWFGLIFAVGLSILSYAAGLFPVLIDEENLKYERVITCIGLLVVCAGTGGIKPVLSIFGADQVMLNDTDKQPMEDGQDSSHRNLRLKQIRLKNKLGAFFVNYFFCINVGALMSILLVPLLRRHFGFGVAFFIPTCCMFLALLVFLCNGRSYIHRPRNSDSPVITTFYLCLWLLQKDLYEYRFMNNYFPCWKPSPVPRYGQHSLVANDDIDVSFHDGSIDDIDNEDDDDDEDDSYIDDSKDDFSDQPERAGLARFESEPNIIRSLEKTSRSDPSLVPVTHLASLSNKERSILEAQLSDAKRAIQIMPIMASLPVFWMLYDQQLSVWTLQATKMNLHGIEPEQLNVLNPVAMILLLPLFDRVIFPSLAKVGLGVSPLRRIGWGMILAALSFFISGILEYAIMFEQDDNAGRLSVFWQLPQYFIMAIGEILVSVTGLEFAYSVSPDRLKGFIMAMYLLGIAKGDFWAGILWSSVFRRMDRAVVLFSLSVMMLLNLTAYGCVVRQWELRDKTPKRINIEEWKTSIRGNPVDHGADMFVNEVLERRKSSSSDLPLPHSFMVPA